MRKLIAVLIAAVLLFLNTSTIFAADGDYKNNLLKIEITKLDESHYDIGLFTQRMYNEPVRVVKKSDTVYYLLLPETSHSITSVPPLGAIKSVIVKSYPYAGQDMSNSYTKIAIITTKAITLTASLKTAENSISPRLDPLRLAKLDQVFERYSERLAQNNIPTPLAEFRKKSSSKAPEVQGAVAVSTKANSAESFEEYQNKVNQEQNVKKSNAVKAAQNNKKQANAQAKTANAKKPLPVHQVKPAVKNEQPKEIEAKKLVTTQVAPKSVAQAPVVAAKEVVTRPVEVKTVLKPVSRPVNQAPKKVAQAPVQKAPVVQKKAETRTVAPVQKETAPVSLDKKEIEPTSKANNEQQEKAAEYEKQLATKEPVNVEFGERVPVDLASENKEIQAEVIQPIETIPDVSGGSEKKNSPFLYVGVFVVLLALYALSKANSAKKARVNYAQANNDAASEPVDIKEYMKRGTNRNAEQEQDVPQAAYVQPQVQEPVRPVEILNPMLEETNQEQAISEYSPSYNIEHSAQYNDAPHSDEEKVEAFNAYMDTVAAKPEFIMNEPEEEDILQTEDDVLIRELYTPVETDLVANYDSENEPASESVSGNNEVATIVSSSKLTETRGLYLAKFEGTTSLVGYIQDDIYILYNFGDMEVKETGIESRLAQENETDSLYIVRTGGKKLMVKSTPYDLSLEMVM